jgi:hypothetical protein
LHDNDTYINVLLHFLKLHVLDFSLAMNTRIQNQILAALRQQWMEIVIEIESCSHENVGQND